MAHTKNEGHYGT